MTNLIFQNKIQSAMAESIETKKNLLDNYTNKIEEIGIILANQIQKGNKILFCGNGGSAADSQHLAAELVVRLRSHYNRPAIAALALTVDTSILTAGGNDIGFENIFARGVEAYGKSGDVLIGISTSGNSENVIRAINLANTNGLITIGMLGGNGGKMKDLCNNSIIVPSNNTARIQESHIMIGHLWCEIIEEVNYPLS